jgi:hypothetical protein
MLVQCEIYRWYCSRDTAGLAQETDATITLWTRLNQFVRHLWLRYPNWVGDWLIRDVILGEILEGLRRDKILPAGPIKDIQVPSRTGAGAQEGGGGVCEEVRVGIRISYTLCYVV